MTTGTAEAAAEARARAARAYSAANCMRIGAPRRAESVEPGGQLLGRHNTVQYLARCSVVVRRSFRFTFVTFLFFLKKTIAFCRGSNLFIKQDQHNSCNYARTPVKCSIDNRGTRVRLYTTLVYYL